MKPVRKANKIINLLYIFFTDAFLVLFANIANLCLLIVC